MKDADLTWKYLSDLLEVLQARNPNIMEAKASSESLLPAAENLTKSEPVIFDNMILQAGTVDSIEVVAEEKEDILPPHQIEQALGELQRNVDNILSKWQEMVDAHMTQVLSGNIMIDNAFVEEFKIDRMNVDFVNDVRQEQAILPEGDQEFINPLRAESIFAQALEVDSLCGIPSQCKLNRGRVISLTCAINKRRKVIDRYQAVVTLWCWCDIFQMCILYKLYVADWTLRNGTTNVLTGANGSIEYSNDTVTVHSDLTVEKLRVNSLNGTDIDQLFNDLFIINERQEITGRV